MRKLLHGKHPSWDPLSLERSFCRIKLKAGGRDEWEYSIVTASNWMSLYNPTEIGLTLRAMTNKLRIALIREGKVPPDRRVAFDPAQCREIIARFPVDLVVEPSDIRCFSDDEYQREGVALDDRINSADILFGIKEVPVERLVEGKTYFFFSHTIKKQVHNRELLRAILKKRIRLIDYEKLTDQGGQRLAAFGFYAGVVGAHNALYTYGKRNGLPRLPRMKYLHDYAEAQDLYRSIEMPPCRIVVAGKGRVGKGAVKVLLDMGFEQFQPEAYLEKGLQEKKVFTVLGPEHYVRRKDGGEYRKADFYAYPGDFESAFMPFAMISDIFINAILWKPGSPAFFALEEMASENFRITVIADITCDIAPVTSVPSTVRASTIEEPIFGFDPRSGEEVPPHAPGCIDMMTIDNLPSELPRDASTSFGAQLMESVVPEIFLGGSDILRRATICEHGHLTDAYAYLQDFVEGK